MKKNYITPTCSLTSTVLKHSLLVQISGKVENPEESDVKTRDSCMNNDNDDNSEWGTLW